MQMLLMVAQGAYKTELATPQAISRLYIAVYANTNAF